jgi:hypothetical protein
MSNPFRRSAVEVFFLSLWALLSLVLLFTVVLLVREMVKSGKDPLAALRPRAAASAQTPAPAQTAAPQANLGMREVSLYFASRDGRRLEAETREIPCGDSLVENCRAALEALLRGPTSPDLAPVLPANARIRGLYALERGEIVIDFSSEMKTEHIRFQSLSLEALMAYGVTNTLCQRALRGGGDSAQQVRLLFDGSPPDTFPAHLDVAQAIAPDAEWTAPERETPAHD